MQYYTRLIQRYSSRPRREWFDEYAGPAAVGLIICVFLFLGADCGSGWYKGDWKPVYGKLHDKEHQEWTTKDDDGHRKTHHKWILKVILAGETWQNVEVTESQYRSLCTGDHLRLIRRMGGITGWTYNYGFDAKVDPRSIPGETL